MSEVTIHCHGHGDHAFVEAVRLNTAAGAVPYTVETLETDHDDQGGTLRGKNKIHIFRFDNLSVAHLGDLGHMPGEAIREKLRRIDCLLIPVGGFYTVGPDVAEQIVRAVIPKVTVPMHYRTEDTGFDVLAHLSDFSSRFEQVNTCVNTYTLTGEEKEEILVMHYKP